MDIEKFKEEHTKMISSHGGYYAVNKRLLEQKVYISLYFGSNKGSKVKREKGRNSNITRIQFVSTILLWGRGLRKPRSLFCFA